VDLDGTLYHATWMRLAMGAELLLCDLPSVRIVRAFREELERMRTDEALTEPDLFQIQLLRTAQRLGVGRDVVEQAIRRWMLVQPRKWLRLLRRRTLIAEIESFRRAGGRTAVVSDYPASDKLEALGVRPLFDVVVASGEPDGPGRLKPWPDGYLLAARRLAVDPSDCLVLGDRPETDGQAAQRAGMRFRRVF
jgi:phosphoglycolate phosphatase/putative hydrolase of the HAD superfamily